MRPPSIVNFERIVLATLFLGLVGSWLNWDQARTVAADAGMGTGFVLTVQVISVVVTLILLYFIARKGSPVAKWIYVVITVLGVIGGLANPAKLLESGGATVVVAIAQILLSLVALWFLFRPDAKAWFAEGRGESA